MTREEEINIYLKERNTPITSLEANSIIEGIEWADEHPNPDMVNKQEFIERACEYLESVLKHDLGYYGAAQFADTFRKLMEE